MAETNELRYGNKRPHRDIIILIVLKMDYPQPSSKGRYCKT
jgi:hypothetical protein